MTVPISYFASMHYSVHLMLQETVRFLNEEVENYQGININILNLDHVQGLPDAPEPYCFFGYSLGHSICKQQGRNYEASEGMLQFVVGTPTPNNDQAYFSEFHIQFFYDALEKFANLFCMSSINIQGEILDTSLLRFEKIDNIMTSSKDGYIVSECVFDVIFSPE